MVLLMLLDSYVYRLVPVSDTTVANLPEIETLCRKVFAAFFDRCPDARYTVSYYFLNHVTNNHVAVVQNRTARQEPYYNS